MTSPLEFIEPLVALVPQPPQPRLHLIRLGVRVGFSLRRSERTPRREHGVRPPNANLRALIQKILDRLGLHPQPPPKGRARERGPRCAT
ncbi:MAG: hypothetical protein U5L05_09075 [Rubrivivax sp.]|nr:hypothetical protein [Rubrivivax sp.]